LVLSTQSSRTRVKYPNSTSLSIDRILPVSPRYEPSSRSSLCGEQPHPWDHLQPQVEKSRHRGAKQRVRYGLQPTISLFRAVNIRSLNLISIRHHIAQTMSSTLIHLWCPSGVHTILDKLNLSLTKNSNAKDR